MTDEGAVRLNQPKIGDTLTHCLLTQVSTGASETEVRRHSGAVE